MPTCCSRRAVPRSTRSPPLRLDLDFMDTSGYVILPVESPAIPSMQRRQAAPSGPHEKLQITQILDERQAKDGKLVLEVKATARGLVPDLDQILDVRAAGFEIDKTDDQGLSVSKFDPESEANLVDSERTWLVHFLGGPIATEAPKTFKFASAKGEGAETVYQRYVDADLAKVGPEVPLEARYGQPTYAWVWWLVGGLLLAALLAAALIALLRSLSRRVKSSRFRSPKSSRPSRCSACSAISTTTTALPRHRSKSSPPRSSSSSATTSPAPTTANPTSRRSPRPGWPGRPEPDRSSSLPPTVRVIWVSARNAAYSFEDLTVTSLSLIVAPDRVREVDSLVICPHPGLARLDERTVRLTST